MKPTWYILEGQAGLNLKFKAIIWILYWLQLVTLPSASVRAALPMLLVVILRSARTSLTLLPETSFFTEKETTLNTFAEECKTAV